MSFTMRVAFTMEFFTVQNIGPGRGFMHWGGIRLNYALLRCCMGSKQGATGASDGVRLLFLRWPYVHCMEWQMASMSLHSERLAYGWFAFKSLLNFPRRTAVEIAA